MTTKQVKLWGCPGCGSEFTNTEKQRSINESGGKYECWYCTYERPLEDLGNVDVGTLLESERNKLQELDYTNISN